jgi:hypothetical protein
MLNLVYIKAAIEAKTGIRLRLKQVAQYLVEEGFITKDQANKAVFYSYESFNTDPVSYKTLDNPVPVDQELANWTPIEQDESSEDE